MRIQRYSKPLDRFYTLSNHVDKAKCLGVMITEHLDWSPHVNSIATMKIYTLSSSKETLTIAHKITIRICMCYMDPYQIKDIPILESV